MFRFSTAVVATALAGVVVSAGAARAQDVSSIISSDGGYLPSTGWTFTPTLVYGVGHDDNVLLRGVGDDVRGDMLNLLGPHADLSFVGRRSQLTADYSGGFSFYRDLGSLNTYDQHGSIIGRRLLSKHVSVYASDSFSASPTTALLEVIGVPYIRTGSDVNSTRAGIDAQLTKRITVSGAYDFEWVNFQTGGLFNGSLLGGHSHGASGTIRYQINDLTYLTADGGAIFATVNNGLDNFNTVNGTVGIERRLSDTFRVFAAAGASHLGPTVYAPAQTGPAYRLGLTKQFEKATVDVNYTQSFVPAFGFGGTMQNQELSGHVMRPLTRRISASAGFSWRTNDPLITGQLPLHMVWAQANVGYAVSQWLRVEGFYFGVHQTIDQPGGILDRNQFGVQVVTSKPMRIR